MNHVMSLVSTAQTAMKSVALTHGKTTRMSVNGVDRILYLNIKINLVVMKVVTNRIPLRSI